MPAKKTKAQAEAQTASLGTQVLIPLSLMYSAKRMAPETPPP